MGANRPREATLTPPSAGAWTLGFGSARDAVVERWIGSRLVWWPRGVLRKRWLGVASSRLVRDLWMQRRWFQVLRAVCDQVARDDEALVVADRTTTSRFVDRCTALCGVDSRRLVLAESESTSLSDWRDECERKASTIDERELFVSPPLTRSNCTLGPPRDRLVVALAERLFVSHVRPKGHMHQLLRARLQDEDAATGRVFVALGRGLTDPDVAAELLDLGAVGWFVADADSRAEPLAEYVAAPPPPCSLPSWEYLTHCTRRHDGPWPGQSESAYLDDLILDRPSANHSPLATLRHIVAERRIHASSQAIRGGSTVVGFTAIPLAELPAQRTFRGHRGRWDFEPYGIGIRRDWLMARGARPVQYGDDADWSSLPPADQPYFQQRFTRNRAIDWSTEREWRTVGDVSLGNLPPDAAFLFVPTAADAARLQRESPWPVLVVDGWGR